MGISGEERLFRGYLVLPPDYLETRLRGGFSLDLIEHGLGGVGLFAVHDGGKGSKPSSEPTQYVWILNNHLQIHLYLA